MKTNTTPLSVVGTLVIAALLVIGILKIQQAYAQVSATSSDAIATSSTVTNPATDATTSTATGTTTSPSTDAATTTVLSGSVTVTPTEPPPQGLTEVHIIGTKYIDYFSDGTTVTAFPGDPAIDSNFSKPDAPIPTHAGPAWVHTTGGYLYDTPSGDLEVGDYAVQSDGTNIVNAPPFVSSTSTPAVSSAPDTRAASPAVLGASTSTVLSSPDTSSPPQTSAATNTVSTEAPIAPADSSSTTPTVSATTT